MSTQQQPENEAGAPAQQEQPQLDFNDVFSLRRPRDAKAGLSSGLKSVTKGLVAGVTGLVAGPVIGAKQEGFRGAAKGVVAGVVGAVVLPVTGVTVGAVQMVRGVINTPEAVSEAGKGRIWDQERRAWVDKPDGTIITVEDAKKSAPRGTPGRKPAAGVDYYEVLQVPRDANGEQIKRAYYMLARKWHPDKNPGDATAHERFQLLGEAYQVLGNEELRARYDQHGTEGLDVNFMDSGEFFNMLFGNDMFEHLVGELVIAVAAREGGNMNAAQLKYAQAARVEKLVLSMKGMLARHVGGDVEGFKAEMQKQAADLAAASFGETMLHAIGRVYMQQADIRLAGFFGGLAAKMKASHDNMKSQLNAASAAIKVYQAQQKIEALQREKERKAAEGADVTPVVVAGTKSSEGGESDASGTAAATAAAEEEARKARQEAEEALQRQALEEAALPLMLEAMWAANVIDIQNTLRKVCERVLDEQGVTAAELKARAQALRELGLIFKAAKHQSTEVAVQPAAGSKDEAAASAAAAQAARRQMEEAMMRAMEKRAGVSHHPDE